MENNYCSFNIKNPNLQPPRHQQIIAGNQTIQNSMRMHMIFPTLGNQTIKSDSQNQQMQQFQLSEKSQNLFTTTAKRHH